MELIFGFLLVVLLLAALDVAALRWGANTRPTSGSDWKPRYEDYYL